jgi:SAM-dependent methyltransferase
MREEQFELHSKIEDTHWWFVGRRYIVRRIVNEILPASRAIRIIDIGCGTGGNLGPLASDYSCIGVDTSKRAIALAMQRFPSIPFFHSNPNGLVSALPVSGSCLFMLLDVLEHIEDDSGFFLELLSVAKEGDHILVTVPARMSLWSPQDVNHGHHRRYESETLARLWEGQAVEEILVSYFNSILFPVVYVVRKWNRWRDKTWGEAGTDLKIQKPWLNSILTSLFSIEAEFFCRLLRHGRHLGLPFGVSVMALLKKTRDGNCQKPY